MFVYILANSYDVTRVFYSREKEKLLPTLVKNLLSNLQIVNNELYIKYANHKFASVDDQLIKDLIAECQMYNNSGEKFFHVINEIEPSNIDIPFFVAGREGEDAPAAARRRGIVPPAAPRGRAAQVIPPLDPPMPNPRGIIFDEVLDEEQEPL